MVLAAQHVQLWRKMRRDVAGKTPLLEDIIQGGDMSGLPAFPASFGGIITISAAF
jgi:hypothetical protein